MPRKKKVKTDTTESLSPEANAQVDAMYAGVAEQIKGVTPIAGPLEKLKHDLGLKTAAELPAQLPPPEPELSPDISSVSRVVNCAMA